METVWGVKWPIATPAQVLVIFLILVLMAFIYLGLKYLQIRKERRLKDYSLFLFKTKKLGLSNFQIKVLNNIIDILKLPNPNAILTEPAVFEKAVGKMLTFLKQRDEDAESFFTICRDLTITYEKLYHASRVRKPLENLTEIEINQLLYFTTQDNDVYFGKVASVGKGILSIKLFRDKKELVLLSGKNRIKVFIWRVGDAEYTFESETLDLAGNILTMRLPVEFTRDQEFRHPYLDVIIPCQVTRIQQNPLEESAPSTGTIYKINDYEAVIRISEKQDYAHRYTLEFMVNDFNFTIGSKIIANRTIQEENIFYYTLKFEELSDAAKNVLKNFIYEHL